MDHWLIHLLWLTHFERPMWLWCMVAVLPGKPKPCDHCPGGSGGLPHGITENYVQRQGNGPKNPGWIADFHPGTYDPCGTRPTATSGILRKACELQEFLVVLLRPTILLTELVQFSDPSDRLLIAHNSTGPHSRLLISYLRPGNAPGLGFALQILAFPPCSIHLLIIYWSWAKWLTRTLDIFKTWSRMVKIHRHFSASLKDN